MTIIPLQEGIFSVDPTKVFTPFNSAVDRLADRAIRSVVLAVQPFLVRTECEYILLDTGLGPLADGTSPLLNALARHSIQPEQISKVILSHLHKDHTGGIGYWSADGSYQMRFPQATYYLQERELAYARQQSGNPSYHQPTLVSLAAHCQVSFLAADAGQIGQQIAYRVSGGHTPFHQTLLIREGGQTVFFGGDELPQRSYLEHNLAYKNDYDGRKAMLSRVDWLRQARQEQWTALLYHDPLQPLTNL